MVDAPSYILVSRSGFALNSQRSLVLGRPSTLHCPGNYNASAQQNDE